MMLIRVNALYFLDRRKEIRWNPELVVIPGLKYQLGENGDLVDPEVEGEVDKPAAVVDNSKFNVGTHVVDSAFIDSLLNARKLELMQDPEIVALLNHAMKNNRSS